MNILRKLYQAQVKELDELTFEAVITTGTVDRDGQVVRPEGVDFSNYMQNPVVMYGHNYDDLPIAKTLSITADGDALVARFQFPPEGTYEKADTIRKLWTGGFLNATSIGFIPKRVTDGEGNEVDGNYQDANLTMAESELLEYSIVPVPSNFQALRRALEVVEVKIADLASKPYPSEHACRLRDPGDFQDNSFRRMERDHEGKKYAVIMGKLKGDDTMTEQAYRYPKDTWDADVARAHCEAAEGNFEAASEEESKAVKEGRVLSGKDHAMFSDIVKDLKAAVKSIENYLDTNAPAPKALEATATDNETTNVTAVPEFQLAGQFADMLRLWKDTILEG